MRSTRYSTSRQKACHQCAAAKSKCDRKPPLCTRCAQRGLSCAYASACDSTQSQLVFLSSPPPSQPEGSHLVVPAPAPAPAPDQQHHHHDDHPQAGFTSPAAVGASCRAAASSPEPPPSPPPASAGTELHDFAFSNLDLICPINPDDIANRWLNTFVPLPGQAVKHYSPSISAFIHRVLKSYANRCIRGHTVPPFIHWSQLALPPSSSLSQLLPLSKCLSVIRTCATSLPPDRSIAEILQREMAKLYDWQTASDNDDADADADADDAMPLLSAFQAHLIYAMVIFFRLGRDHDPFLRQAMLNTQDLACRASQRGLQCAAEQPHPRTSAMARRPQWESWIVAETKRRTLFTMCMFDSALLTTDGLATHLAVELRGLLAPGSKALWEARDRRDWEARYDVQLAVWRDEDGRGAEAGAGGEGGFLRIEELWPMPEEFGEAEVERRRARVDLWLEDVDEFGTMVYAVTNCTHGG